MEANLGLCFKLTKRFKHPVSDASLDRVENGVRTVDGHAVFQAPDCVPHLNKEHHYLTKIKLHLRKCHLPIVLCQLFRRCENGRVV